MKKDPNHDDMNYAGGVAGLVRTLSKNIGTAFRYLRKVRLEKLTPNRTWATTADRVSTLLELRSHYTVTEQSLSSERKKSTNRKQNFRLTLIIAIPELVKSTVLGTVLFEMYDYSSFQLRRYVYSEEDSRYNNLVHILSGAISGMLNGTLYIYTDKLSPYIWPSFMKLSRKELLNVRGVIFSHTIYHGILFGTYGTTHATLNSFLQDIYNQYEPKKDPTGESLVQCFSAFITGGVAGVLAESFNSIAQPIEKNGVYNGIIRIRNQIKFSSSFKFPPLHNHFLPSAVGFLAYDLSKQFSA